VLVVLVRKRILAPEVEPLLVAGRSSFEAFGGLGGRPRGCQQVRCRDGGARLDELPAVAAVGDEQRQGVMDELRRLARGSALGLVQRGLEAVRLGRGVRRDDRQAERQLRRGLGLLGIEGREPRRRRDGFDSGVGGSGTRGPRRGCQQAFEQPLRAVLCAGEIGHRGPPFLDSTRGQPYRRAGRGLGGG
jgi:hypothetical protein